MNGTLVTANMRTSETVCYVHASMWAHTKMVPLPQQTCVLVRLCVMCMPPCRHIHGTLVTKKTRTHVP